jgi:hypothetical protein
MAQISMTARAGPLCAARVGACLLTRSPVCQYAYYADVRALGERKKSLVIYHHLARQGTALEQVRRRAEQLREQLPLDYHLAALRFWRGSSRVFYVAAAPKHRQVLTQPTTAF